MEALELVSGVAGALLSLICSYVPGVRVWFGKLAPEGKRLVMLGLLVLATALLAGLACVPVGALLAGLACVPVGAGSLASDFGLAVRCDRPGLVDLVGAFLMALVANQGVFLISPTLPTPSPFLKEGEREDVR